jgi:hypothetical protein
LPQLEKEAGRALDVSGKAEYLNPLNEALEV